MRLRLPVARSVFFLAALLLCLVALFPLRAALDWIGLDERGVSAREVKGSLWFGGLSEAGIGPVALGDVAARLRTFPLLLGHARVDLEPRGDEAGLSLGFMLSGHGFGIEDATGRIVGGLDLGPLRLVDLDLVDLEVRFRGELCEQAAGAVTARLGEMDGIPLPSTFSGNAKCASGSLLLPLVSQSGMERLDLRIAGDGSYRIDISTSASDAATLRLLAAAGFLPGPGGYRFALSGRL